jgi:chloramphenicol O-acetyltransferase type A
MIHKREFIMKEIDLSIWRRKAHYDFFSRMDYPQFNICFNIDITDMLSFVKEQKISFYYAMIYLSTKSANQIEEFRYRGRDGTVILHDTLNPAFSDMDKDDDLFKMVALNTGSNLKDFVSAAKNKADAQEEYFVASDFIGRDDYIYYTSIPWISFTHISHTISLNRNDSVPRISWGKYFDNDTRVMLPFSVQAHHAFVDGIHIGKFKEVLEHTMENIGSL